MVKVTALEGVGAGSVGSVGSLVVAVTMSVTGALVPEVLGVGELVGRPEDAKSGPEGVGPLVTGREGEGLGDTAALGEPLDGMAIPVTVADGEGFCESAAPGVPEQALQRLGATASTETSKGDRLFTSLL